MTILEKIAQNAKEHPDRIAYVDNYIAKNQLVSNMISWRELDEKSGKLASYLNDRLISNKPVIVYGHKNPLMIVCFLACAKCGRAYVPIDQSLPIGRTKEIIDSVNPEIILSTELLELFDNRIFDADSMKQAMDASSTVISSDQWIGKDDVFYIIFTSGSTGTPKGVQITRDCLDNFVKWGITLCNEAKDLGYVFLNQAPFSFDLSVMDLYLAMYLGGTEFTIGKEILQEMKFLIELFGKSGATVWVSTPSFADICLSDRSFCENLLPNLRTFLFCGETLTNRTAERLQKAFPKAVIYNTYGPTESTVAVTGVLVTNEVREKINPLPVGQPKEGTWILIMDSSGNILPEDEKGEIVIVGDSVSIGYWNDVEKSDKAFSIHTINNETYRLYHTGDKGYFRNGQLYYSGRVDLQVKLHGYRIEIEDIENNLMKISNISNAVVMPVYRSDGEVKSLTAYVVANNINGNEFEKAQQIRHELKSFVPDYMIPKKIKFLESLPMTSNGKVNRKELREL